MDSELFFLMKTHNIRWQRAAIVLGGQRDSGPVRSVYPDNPGDNSGSLLFIATNKTCLGGRLAVMLASSRKAQTSHQARGYCTTVNAGSRVTGVIAK
jgi:hypothetical protein